MSVDVVATCIVLHRYDQRENGIVATKQWQIWIDDNYNDARMEKIYPNAKNCQLKIKIMLLKQQKCYLNYNTICM